MDPEIVFVLKVVLSFIIGGAWVSLTTILAQKLGTKIGGIIGGLPSTGLTGILFVALTQGADTAVEATTVIPACLGATCGLMLCYAASIRLGLFRALAIGFSAWLLAQFIIIRFGPPSFPESVLSAAIGLVAAVWCYEKVLCVESAQGATVAVTPALFLFRAAAAGTVVAITVLLARFSGPLLSGVFAVFPVTMMTTLVITYRQIGPAFSRAISKSHLIGGVVTCTIYVAAVRYLYPISGIWIGTLVSYLISLVSSIGVYHYMHRYVR